METTGTTCVECVDEHTTDLSFDMVGDCVLCGDATCGWHGKEYHSRMLNGTAHHDCYAFIGV